MVEPGEENRASLQVATPCGQGGEKMRFEKRETQRMEETGTEEDEAKVGKYGGRSRSRREENK